MWGASSSSTLYGIRQNSWADFSQNRLYLFHFFKRTSVSRWRSIRERTSTAETSSSRCWQIHFLWIRVRAGCGSSPPSPTLASHSKRVGPWSSSSSSSDHIQAPKRREREKDEVGTSKQTKKESESLVKVIYDSTNDQKQESFVTQNSLCQKEIRKFKIKIKCTFKVTVNS